MKSPSSHKVRTPRSFLGPVTAVAAALAAGALLFACAGSEVPVDDTATTDAATDTAPKPTATATAPRDAAPPKVCASSCTQDSDCESSCPSGSTPSCCDVTTKTCFRNTAATCPVPQAPFDAATPPTPGPY